MIELLPLSIGIGLVVGLLFTELFGMGSGGLVVPGYVALALTRPLDVILTVLAGVVTYSVVHAISTFLIAYGRRRTVLMILIGYLVGMALRWVSGGPGQTEMDVIGFIIPGLIALWIDRQGIVQTLAALTTASVLVRLILVVIVGQELAS